MYTQSLINKSLFIVAVSGRILQPPARNDHVGKTIWAAQIVKPVWSKPNQTGDTVGLNEQKVYKNVSGVLLSVPKDFFKFPLNAPTQKIIGWEIFVQSQSKHFIPVQKQVK